MILVICAIVCSWLAYGLTGNQYIAGGVALVIFGMAVSLGYTNWPRL